MLTLITNGSILTPAGWMDGATIKIDGSRIVSIENGTTLPTQTPDSPEAEINIIDAKGAYIIPGGIDLHLHGGGGHDFLECSEEAFRTAIAAHMRH